MSKKTTMGNPRIWNYDEIAEKFAMNCIDIGEEAIPFMLEEARKRKDADVIVHVAEWFEDRDDIKRYLELAMEAAELGSQKANFWLGYEYRSGENLPRDYEKAYECFIKGKEVDWVPIDLEENAEIMDGNGGEVTAETLLLHGDIDWWLFLFKKHPTRALKCGLADWYMKQGGDENREKALKLFEESANEGFEFAFVSLIKVYSEEFKDIEKGKYWFYKAEEHGFDESVFADQLGVESLECRKLKVAADNGDCRAAGKLACAYLHGGYGDCVCCAKDEALARHYGILAGAEEDGVDELVMGLDGMNLEDQLFLSEVAK
ncbi:MAG: sel1 repeat family protein [Kiritimatiellae bacterium]|nr:sel1 repeat family protein [Kiritimatiellia bacterium]